MVFFKVSENLRGTCKLVLLTHVIVYRIDLGVAGATLLLLSAVFMNIYLLCQLLVEVPKVQADLFVF
jgi:hypothetical protein